MRESPMKRIEKAIQEQGAPQATSRKIPARFKREEIEKEKQKPTRQVIAVGPEESNEDEESNEEISEPELTSSHFTTKQPKATRSSSSGLPPPPDSKPFQKEPVKRTATPPRTPLNNSSRRNTQPIKIEDVFDNDVKQKRRMFDDPEEVRQPASSPPIYKDQMKVPEKKGFFGFGKKSKDTIYVPQVEQTSQPKQTNKSGSKKGALKGMISLVIGMLLLVVGAELNGTINTSPIVNKTLALLVYGHSVGVVAMVIGGILIYAGYTTIRASKGG